jgi:hypothetical protein
MKRKIEIIIDEDNYQLSTVIETFSDGTQAELNNFQIYDLTHEIKFLISYKFDFEAAQKMEVGSLYLSRSGGMVSYVIISDIDKIKGHVFGISTDKTGTPLNDGRKVQIHNPFHYKLAKNQPKEILLKTA